MTTYKLPNSEELSNILELFLPDAVATSNFDGKPSNPMSHAAVYKNDGGKIVSACACCLSLAAALGSALSMIPPDAAGDMVKEGELTKVSQDNLYEVMNIFSSLLMDDRTPHLKLTDLLTFAEVPSVQTMTNQVCFEIDAGPYGKGYVIFFAL